MKKLFLIANWKSYKTTPEAMQWLQEFQISNFKYQISNEKEIVVCPSFTLLPEISKFINENNLPIKLGVQNVSSFGEGAFTGEIFAKQAGEFTSHAIFGHSE